MTRGQIADRINCLYLYGLAVLLGALIALDLFLLGKVVSRLLRCTEQERGTCLIRPRADRALLAGGPSRGADYTPLSACSTCPRAGGFSGSSMTNRRIR